VKHASIVLIACLLCACTGSLRAAQTDQREFTCPLDDHKFTSTVVTTRDKAGGTDSDFCPYERGPQALPFEVHTCPLCGFSASTTEFEQRLDPELVKKIQTILTTWKDANKVTDGSKIPTWQQYELAALCGFAKFSNHLHAGNLYLRAAWSARMEAVGNISSQVDLSNPLSAIEVADMLGGKIDREADATKKTALRFRLLQVYHRAGMGAQRDALLTTLAAAPPDDPFYARFKELVTVEKKYLPQAADFYLKAIEAGEPGKKDTGLYLYLIGDLHRRVGQNTPALQYYQKALKTDDLRPDIKELIDFLGPFLKPSSPKTTEK